MVWCKSNGLRLSAIISVPSQCTLIRLTEIEELGQESGPVNSECVVANRGAALINQSVFYTGVRRESCPNNGMVLRLASERNIYYSVFRMRLESDTANVLLVQSHAKNIVS